MANLEIGLGVMRTDEDEKALHEVADALPESWTIVMVGDLTTGIFEIRISGSGSALGSKSFPPDGVSAAIAWLASIAKRRDG
jgi:hypothetical protein